MTRAAPIRVLLPAATAFVVSLLGIELGMPRWTRLLAPPAGVLLVSLVLGRREARNAAAADTERNAGRDAAEARIAAMTASASQMRHDLRGILSPALLMADRLAMSQDPVAKRAADTMIATVERAEARLRRDP